MYLKRLVLAACVLLVAVLAAIAIAVLSIDPRSLAASLAASVKADTGRELTISEAGFRLLPRPALVLSKVRFGNAAWGSQPWLAQAGRVSANVGVLELLFGRLHIRHIAISDASIFLETDPKGNGNWVMGPANARVPGRLKTLEIDEIDLQAVALAFRNGASGSAASVRIDSARIAAPSASRPIQLRVRAAFSGKTVEVTGTIGALAALIANTADYPVNLEGKLGAASVSVHGTIARPRDMGQFSLALRAQLPEFSDVAALFGATVPPLGPFRGAALLTSCGIPVGTGAAPGGRCSRRRSSPPRRS